MSTIPDRVWPLLTPEEKENLEAVLDGWRYSPTVKCVKCGCEMAIRLRVTAGAVIADDREKTPPTTRSLLSAADQKFLEAAKTSGLFDAFASATKAEKEFSGVPSDIENFFLMFWKTAQPIRVGTVVLAAWIEEFGGRIDVLQANGVIAVLSDGQLVAFVPNRLTLPASASGKGPQVRVSTAGAFELWRKNKYGYVPVNARSFGEALRQHSIGDFGKLVQ